jgi:hypothetical protein
VTSEQLGITIAVSGGDGLPRAVLGGDCEFSHLCVLVLQSREVSFPFFLFSRIPIVANEKEERTSKNISSSFIIISSYKLQASMVQARPA